MKPFVLTIDVGTSSLKIVIYGINGKVLASESFHYDHDNPHPGWAEISSTEWIQALDYCLNNLVLKPDLLEQIEVIAVTGQMHTAVLLDDSLQPLEPIILWTDRRATQETDELQQVFNLPPFELNSTYTLPKLYWIKKYIPKVIKKTRHIIWPKDYIRLLMTGTISTDVTEAGGAGLLNWKTLDWATERLSYIGIDPQILPRIEKPEQIVSQILLSFAKKYKINPHAKVIVGIGDVLALISGAPPKKGRINYSLGSSSMIFTPLNKDEFIVDPENRIYTYPLLKIPMFGGVSSTTGAALQWAAKNFYPNKNFNSAIAEAIEIKAGSEGVIFLPFLSGERSPFWNDKLRGSFHGLSLSHSRAHFLRAVMEGVGYSLAYIIDIFNELQVDINQIALSGGGASTPSWPQIISDICQLPVGLFTGRETVTKGLFAYAFVAIHDNSSFDQALLNTFDDPIWIYPDKELSDSYKKGYEFYNIQAEFNQNMLLT